jgi:hypothetical protein
MMERLVAAIGGLEAMIHKQAKVWVEIKINKEEIKEEMKAQVGSLDFQINANQEQMDANLKDIIAEMKAW